MIHELHVWREGRHIGVFTATNEWDIGFEYDSDAPETPISFSLPRQGGWVKKAPRNFLDNLLPEDPGTRIWMSRFTDSTNDDFGLLNHADIAGGLILSENSELPALEERPLRRMSDGQIAARIAALKDDSNERWEKDSVNKVSLAGAQAKFSLTRKDGDWYRSNDLTPSTHIFKPESRRTMDAELMEDACMRLSAACGIPTPGTRVLRFEDETTFCVDRFDRRINGDRIERLQCEDFLQALGRPANEKYGVKAKHVLAMLHEIDPTDELSYQWIERLAFNVGINNVDAHAKNYSLKLTNTGISLAPMYDAMTTTYWKWVEPVLAMPVGNNRFAAQITPRNWETFADHNGLDPERVSTIARITAGRILASRDTVFDDLPAHVRNGLNRELDRANSSIQPLDPTDVENEQPIVFPNQTSGTVWVPPHMRDGRPVRGYRRRR